jgi:uncharacterized lipoprotein YajG
MKKIVVLTSLLFMAACSSTSTDLAKTSENTNNDVAASSDRVICRLESQIGSHRKKEVCTTAKERTIRREVAQEALSRRQGGQQTSGADGS